LPITGAFPPLRLCKKHGRKSGVSRPNPRRSPAPGIFICPHLPALSFCRPSRRGIFVCMKGLLLCFLLWVPGIVVGQLSESWKLSESSATKPGYDWRRAIAPAALLLAAGATWSTHETLMHKNALFFKAFPGASRRFWGAESWRNKYTGGDPLKGRNGKPVWFTDGKHLTASVHHTLIFAAGVTVTLGRNARLGTTSRTRAFRSGRIRWGIGSRGRWCLIGKNSLKS